MAAMKMRMVGVLVLVIGLIASQDYFCIAVTADQVYIVNDLGQDLNVHCASKDDDIGFHNILPGSWWEFSFLPNLLGNTLFACDFKSSRYPLKHINVYEGANYFDNSCLCRTCIWTVTPNGFDCNNQYKTGWK